MLTKKYFSLYQPFKPHVIDAGDQGNISIIQLD